MQFFEITNTFASDGEHYFKGERRWLNTDLGRMFCAQGNAADCEGVVSTAQVETQHHEIQPESSSAKNNGSDA